MESLTSSLKQKETSFSQNDLRRLTSLTVPVRAPNQRELCFVMNFIDRENVNRDSQEQNQQKEKIGNIVTAENSSPLQKDFGAFFSCLLFFSHTQTHTF